METSTHQPKINMLLTRGDHVHDVSNVHASFAPDSGEQIGNLGINRNNTVRMVSI
jgi:hypothetical protein